MIKQKKEWNPKALGTVQMWHSFSNLRRNVSKHNNTKTSWSMLISLAKKKNKIVMLETYLKFDPRAFLIAFLPSDSGSARQFVFFCFDNSLQHNRIQYFYTQTTGCRTDKSYFFKRSTTIALSKHTHTTILFHTLTYPHAPTRK